MIRARAGAHADSTKVIKRVSSLHAELGAPNAMYRHFADDQSVSYPTPVRRPQASLDVGAVEIFVQNASTGGKSYILSQRMLPVCSKHYACVRACVHACVRACVRACVGYV